MRALWYGFGWSTAALTALGLLLRWLPVTNTYLVGLVAVLPFVVIPLVIVAGFSAWRSEGLALRVAAGIMALSVVVIFIHPSAVIGCRPSDDDGIVIYSHNLLWNNQDVDGIATAIGDARADLVVLQEFGPQTRWDLEAHPSLQDFHHASDFIEDKIEVALWSRWPLADVELTYFGGRPHLAATVLSPDGEFRAHSTHLAAPIDEQSAASWSEGLEQLRIIEHSGPTLIGGDFNATGHHAQFRAVRGQGWTDVHQPKGCGFDATWPAGHRRVPFPLLQLDHVLVSEHWQVLAVELGNPQGSDHRPLIAKVRMNQ